MMGGFADLSEQELLLDLLTTRLSECLSKEHIAKIGAHS
jgi:hypothetical protein